MQIQTGFTTHSCNSTSSSCLLMPRKDATVRGKEAKNLPLSKKTSHLPEKGSADLSKYIALRRRPRRRKRSSSLPVPRSPESRVRPGRPREFRRGSGCRRRGGTLGLRPTQMSCPLGCCYCYAAAEASARAVSGWPAGGRPHGATWPRDDRVACLGILCSTARAAGLFVSITTISSSGPNCSFKLAFAETTWLFFFFTQ